MSLKVNDWVIRLFNELAATIKINDNRLNVKKEHDFWRTVRE